MNNDFSSLFTEAETARLQELAGEADGAAPDGNANTQKRKPEPLVVTMDSIEEERVEWLWSNRIPRSKITMIDGDPGAGKSFFCLAVAAAITRGEALPGNEKPSAAANVLLMSVEDGFSDTVKPRLRLLEANMKRISIPNPARGLAPTLMNAAFIEQAVKQVGPALLIVDPIIAFSGRKDTDKASQVRALLSPLVSIAQRYALSVIIVRHLNKGNSKSLYRGQGSIDFMAACRSAFVVGEDPEDSSARILAHVKNSLGSKAPSLSFAINASGFFGDPKSQPRPTRSSPLVRSKPKAGSGYNSTLPSAF